MPPVRPLYRFCLVSVAALVTSFAACSRSDAASFDCSKAIGVDEVLICSDQELSELDEELARTYAAVRRTVTGEQWDSLQGNQREWIDRRNVGCQITRATVVTEENKQLLAACLKTATAERLMFLAGLLEVATAGDRDSTDDQSARTGSDPDPAVERASTGSGVIVSEAGLVVTNAHVVDECSDILIANSRVGVARAWVVALDRAADLALLRGDLGPADGVVFRERAVAPGEMIVVIGYPLQGLLGSGPIVSQGIVSAAHGIDDDSSQMQISAPVQAGNSGGPVFDAAGNLVGIVVAKLDALLVAQHIGDVPQNVNFAIKASAVRQFLDTHQVSYRTALEGKPRDVPALVNTALSRVVMVACRKE